MLSCLLAGVLADRLVRCCLLAFVFIISNDPNISKDFQHCVTALRRNPHMIPTSVWTILRVAVNTANWISYPSCDWIKILVLWSPLQTASGSSRVFMSDYMHIFIHTCRLLDISSYLVWWLCLDMHLLDQRSSSLHRTLDHNYNSGIGMVAAVADLTATPFSTYINIHNLFCY